MKLKSQLVTLITLFGMAGTALAADYTRVLPRYHGRLS
jgi:hypothetical protein